MPYLSTGGTYNGSAGTPNQQQPPNGPANYTSAISRFLDDQDQRRPLEFSTVQPVAEIEAAEKARIAARLRAFEQQFDSSREPIDRAQAN
ncbi:hypothetical protein MKX07_008885 [Trichoderma sp. CBMAI-0711]|uniref:Uncharacterized protein n=1 Tax=Trichoderma parareesei TaxID=858221 RepID=A0A2H2ZS26_TRIPA|nr:hypothetical protein MKX07_008885 [Trichoderma sp. CBMAI-0711]OTA08448.1 hypothetical protein A9Z42_0001290 [Trichoderma parareesei]